MKREKWMPHISAFLSAGQSKKKEDRERKVVVAREWKRNKRVRRKSEVTIAKSNHELLRGIADKLKCSNGRLK